MKKLNKVLVSISTFTLFAVLGLVLPNAVNAATAPDLGAADSYSIFGKAGVTNDASGVTNTWGNVGADAIGTITNLIAGQVGGAIIAPAPGVQTAITAAYNFLNNGGLQGAPTPISLSGTPTVTPGVYTVSAPEALDGTVTLNGAGVYIFRSDSAFTVMHDTKVNVTNGADACDVFWQIPTSMTIGSGAEMVGTIITDTGLISLGSDATLQGRALSSVSQVTLLRNQITEPSCVTSVPPVPAAETTELPKIHVEKLPTPSALPDGAGTVVYKYTVTNTGTIEIENVKVTDDKCAAVKFISGDTGEDEILDTTETWKYECTTMLSKTTTNIVTATGESHSGESTKDTDKATVVVGVKEVVVTPVVIAAATSTVIAASTSPKLPNTGFAPEEKGFGMIALLLASILAISGFVFFLRRKQIV